MHCHTDGVSLPEDYSRMAKFKSQAFKISYDFRASPYLQGPQEAVVVYITAKRKKRHHLKERPGLQEKYHSQVEDMFYFLVTAVSSGRHHQASGKHPGAFGIRQDVRMPAPWRRGTMAV